MNYVIRELTLYRHFLLIDSPIPFEFIANPTNYNKDMSDFSRVTGLDVCSRPSGCWRVDCWKLLPKEFQRSNPVFTMLLKYDADLLHEGEVVDVRYSDIDVGEGVAGVNGQLVQILPSTFQPVVNAVDSLRGLNSDGFDSLGRSIGNADVNNVNGFNAVKDSVDSFKSDLLNGVAGVSEPLHFYLGENVHFMKDIRHLASPNPVGFFPTWGNLVTDIPFNGWAGVYTPVSMPLKISFFSNGAEISHSEGFFKAGVNTFHFYKVENPVGYFVDSVDCEGNSVRHIGAVYEVSGLTAVIYSHPVDVYMN